MCCDYYFEPVKRRCVWCQGSGKQTGGQSDELCAWCKGAGFKLNDEARELLRFFDDEILPGLLEQLRAVIREELAAADKGPALPRYLKGE